MNTSEGFNKFLDTMTNLSSLTSTIETKRDEIKQGLVDAKSIEFPSKLYHYTSLLSVEGILRSNNLRTTDFRYLNDTSELIYGADMLVHELDKYAEEKGGDVLRLLNKVGGYYSDHGEQWRSFFETYIISLSEEPDILSQWRAYADQGRGCCIEFDLTDSRIFSIIGTNTPWASEVLPVIYEPEKQYKCIQEGIENLIAYLNDSEWPVEKVVNSSETEEGVVIGLLMHALEPFVTALKHPGFSEEKEWRAITSCAMNLTEYHKKQLGTGENIRYYIDCIFVQGDHEKLWQREMLPITNISLGPLTGDDERENLKKIINEHGYNDMININKSIIPLR